MHFPAAGESAIHLPWLWPDAQSLTSIGKPLSPATWGAVSRDPGACPSAPTTIIIHAPSSAAAVEPARFLEPRVLETALQWIAHDRGQWIDWRQPAVLPLYETALAIAYHARFLAEATHCCDAAAAWTAGLLTPLGWFAIAAADPTLVAKTLSDPDFLERPLDVQQRLWGLDHAAIARRLARRWQLPDWFRGVIGHAESSIHAVELFGADRSLFATVQLAALLAEKAGYTLGLTHFDEEQKLLDRLHLNENDLAKVRNRFQDVDFHEVFEPEWRDPRLDSELPGILQEVMEKRRAESAPFLGLLEQDLDRLHKTLAQVRTNDDRRLRGAKLEALAEFAAGASHEINNPLAVIAGQSQYLLNRDESDDDHRKALESIVRQTKRIHNILNELMQFARPPRIIPQRVALDQTVQKVIDQYRAQADEAGVALHFPHPDGNVWVDGDVRQLQTAIGCLVRNAVEAAAPGKGWVRIGTTLTGSRVEIRVEDSGPGPTSAQREHMFDPFYSGRSAGRGRGLGLPTAWRLAREHGGDVFHVPVPDGPTRFVLTLPLPDHSRRLSA